MTRKPRPPIGDAPRGLRQRLRADGTWRIWWEPRPEDRARGFDAVDLSHRGHDAARREARRLNGDLDRSRESGQRKGSARPAGRCMSDLISNYTASPDFMTRALATQGSYRRLMLQITDKWGAQLVAGFDKATMHTWYETLYRTKGPRMAQALNAMMSILFSRAERLGWRPENSNPCQRLGVVTPQPRDRAATWAEIDALLDAAIESKLPSMALAIRLSLFQGQRQTDVIEARRGAFRLAQLPDPHTGAARPLWVWSFIRSKKKNAGMIPLHPEVIPALRRVLADTGQPDAPIGDDTPLLIEERVGRAYDVFLFNKRWREIRALAEKSVPTVADLQFRDLRRTFGRMARAGGASREDTADVLGNSAATNDVLYETYMPANFETASRAIAAITRPAKTDERKKG